MEDITVREIGCGQIKGKLNDGHFRRLENRNPAGIPSFPQVHVRFQSGFLNSFCAHEPPFLLYYSLWNSPPLSLSVAFSPLTCHSSQTFFKNTTIKQTDWTMSFANEEEEEKQCLSNIFKKPQLLMDTTNRQIRLLLARGGKHKEIRKQTMISVYRDSMSVKYLKIINQQSNSFAWPRQT